MVNRGSGTYNLYKYKSDGTAVGPLTSGGLGVSFSGVKRTVKVTYNAGVIKVFVGGSFIFTFTDSSPLTGTRVGLGQFISDTGTNFKWDNFAAFRGIV